jgi:hypothetical protein
VMVSADGHPTETVEIGTSDHGRLVGAWHRFDSGDSGRFS